MGPVESDGARWAVYRNAGKKLGTRDERMARFEPPSSGSTEWHGYPASTLQNAVDRRIPEDATVESWKNVGWIDYVTYRRILSKRL
jgi:hypothetical protein